MEGVRKIIRRLTGWDQAGQAPREPSPVTCPACGVSRRWAEQRTVLQEHPSSVVQCPACGLKFFWPRPSAGDLETYYSSTDDGSFVEELQKNCGEASEPRLRELTQELLELHEVWARAAPGAPGAPQVRFLEIGCAYGHELLAAQRLGWTVEAVEISAPVAGWVREHLGLPVHQGGVEDVAPRLSKASYDIILMSHVLEHVLDPGATLRALASLLAPGGILAAFVPNGDGLDALLDFAGWEWHAWPNHLCYFGPGSLRRLLEHHGLTVERLWTCVGHSNVAKTLARAQGRLDLGSGAESVETLALLGRAHLLSDLRIIGRAPS